MKAFCYELAKKPFVEFAQFPKRCNYERIRNFPKKIHKTAAYGLFYKIINIAPYFQVI